MVEVLMSYSVPGDSCQSLEVMRDLTEMSPKRSSSSIPLSDRLEVIAETVRSAHASGVLAMQRASGFSACAGSDGVPERMAAMVYVATAPGKVALDADLEGDNPLVWKEIEEEEKL